MEIVTSAHLRLRQGEGGATLDAQHVSITRGESLRLRIVDPVTNIPTDGAAIDLYFHRDADSDVDSDMELVRSVDAVISELVRIRTKALARLAVQGVG